MERILMKIIWTSICSLSKKSKRGHLHNKLPEEMTKCRQQSLVTRRYKSVRLNEHLHRIFTSAISQVRGNCRKSLSYAGKARKWWLLLRLQTNPVIKRRVCTLIGQTSTTISHTCWNVQRHGELDMSAFVAALLLRNTFSLVGLVNDSKEILIALTTNKGNHKFTRYHQYLFWK